MNHEDASYLIFVHIHYTCFCIILTSYLHVTSVFRLSPGTSQKNSLLKSHSA